MTLYCDGVDYYPRLVTTAANTRYLPFNQPLQRK